MGIDIYLSWPGQTTAERAAQYTGFDTHAGGSGYLREAYHGGPYATQEFVAEAFDWEGPECVCPFVLNPEPDDPWAAVVEYENGNSCTFHLPPRCESCQGAPIPAAVLHERVEHAGALVIRRYAAVYDCGPTDPQTVGAMRAYAAFAALAERKERETGEPCRVYASY